MTTFVETLEPRLHRKFTPPKWSEVNDFAYQLQNVDLAELGQSKYDAVVIDYSGDGGNDTAFSRTQVNGLQNSPGGPKRVLSYMSVGEAEDYRYYWKDDFSDRSPKWLGEENPEWEGNYKVKYWQGAWQNVVYSYVDRVMKAGFDGVYLDIIDAYEYWGPAGRNVNPNAERDMVSFVENIAHYARVTRRQPDFAIFAQNGEHLGVYDDYVATVTGIGREDVFYDDNAKLPASEWQNTVRDLKRFSAAGKAVWTIDYATQRTKVDEVYFRSHARGFVAYAATRELDQLLLHAGHEPD